MLRARLTSGLLLAVAVAACSGEGSRPAAGQPPGRAATPNCNAPTVRELVERFGRQMKHVSLLAPDSIRAGVLRREYAPLVTPRLLDLWLMSREDVPGRAVSSPWPDRIDVDSVIAGGDQACGAFGHVVHVTSTDAPAGTREAVTLRLVWHDGWRIDEVVFPNGAGQSVAGGDLIEVVDVVRRYYAAINGKRYREAYGMWSGDGNASGQTFAAFTRQFGKTARIAIRHDGPLQLEGAAGSNYATLPVRVIAAMTDGRVQAFSGTYTFRRSMVDGATDAQRSWQIHSANLQPMD